MNNESNMSPKSHSFFERFINLFFQTQYEWAIIDSENRNYKSIFINFSSVIIIAVSVFTSYSYYGYLRSHLGSPFPNVMIAGLVFYIIFSAIVYTVFYWVCGFIIDKVSTSFGGYKDFNKSMSISLYGLTPLLFASAFQYYVEFSGFVNEVPFPFNWLMPILSILGAYVMTRGAAVLLKVPKQRLIPLFVLILFLNSLGYAGKSYAISSGEKLISIFNILPNRDEIATKEHESIETLQNTMRELEKYR